MRRLPAIGLAAALLASAAHAYSPPSAITPAALGAPTFSEIFKTFDAGEDQAQGKTPHRWRTVMGYGGAASPDNRSGSRATVYVDPGFPGVTEGQLGPKPLGLNPFHLSQDGSLSITADMTPAALKPLLWNRPYTSGVMTTRFSFAQRYGYFEVRARLPHGKGLWPAFWLLPADSLAPAGTELDVFEQLGHASKVVFCTLHYQGRTWFWLPKPKVWEKRVPLPFDTSQGVHAYGAAWSRDQIVWYVDRREVCRQPTPEGMDQPMYMLVNLAVGGSWGGPPDSTTRFPASMQIQAVNVWTLKGS